LVKIYLDGGHGGTDSGASGNGIKEKDIVLGIVLRIEKGLQAYEDVEILLTRSTDIFLTLDQRTDRANAWKADVLLSVHCNSATDSAARGFESYIFPNAGQATTAFQNVMHEEIMRQLGAIQNRGKKSANFHMLRESNMKAILTENLFVSNPTDAGLLKDASVRQRIADGHTIGLEKFLGLKKKSTEPPRSPTGKLYRVQVGAFEDRKNAEALVNDLNKQGYRPIIKYE
jgi:N-acetylmuramoyl-L-alanine amidase